MDNFKRPALQAMTAMSIYAVQGSHVVFLHRINKAALLEMRNALKRAYASNSKTVRLPFRAAHIRKCRPALEEAMRLIDGNKKGKRRK